MTLCDFCHKAIERHDELIFVEAASLLVHICEECVADCVVTIAAKKKENAK